MATSAPPRDGIGEVWINTQFETSQGNANYGSSTAVDTTTWQVTKKVFGNGADNMNHPHNMWTNTENSMIYQTQWFDNKLSSLDRDAAVLVVVVSKSKAEHKEADYPTHAFDTGSAWENLAIESVSRGFVTHAMAGFDYEKARSELEIPDVFEVMAMFAIGKQGPKENLPQELQEREKPADRKELSEIIMEGKFKK
ncbi:nitroreductase protein [Marine Group I thaumarchaeote SCGC AAA799-P11]|uniref:Nitroreductase protein n=1 Tax=Marine Group I thaumarchaeote SCGC AAA799-P11 TaxID=1502295 RepID=A0A087S1G2_9ARCH|nr:nitroreductase protein [Marine Group I thaumarchaeote SCGC AAA799-P11]